MPPSALPATQPSSPSSPHPPEGGGVNHYSADITVTNDGSLPEITGFTLYFDENKFSNLALAASPSTWDSLLIPPDLGIPAAGFLDSFVLDTANRLLTGDTIGGFTVTFDFLGQGAPGAMAFDIVDFDFNVLFSGGSDTTAFVPGTGGSVPEPGVICLMLLALSCSAWAGRHLNMSKVADTFSTVAKEAP